MDKQNCTVVAKEITNKLENLLSGNIDEVLLGKKPEEVVLLGSIKAGQTSESIVDDSKFNVEDDFKSAPMIGINFHKSKAKNLIKIKLYGKFYYRVKPTYSENVKYLLDIYSNQYGIEFSSSNALVSYIKEQCNQDSEFIIPTEKIMYKYKSICIEDFIDDLEINYTNINDVKYTLEILNSTIQEKINCKIDSIREESVNIKNSNSSILTLLDEVEYSKLLQKKTELSVPDWKIKLYSTINYMELYDNVNIQVTNPTSPLKTTNESFDSAIYNVRIELFGDECFKPIELNEIKHNYIKPEDIFGLGINCAVEHCSTSCHIITTNFPYYLQYRVSTVEKYNKYITFDNLINEPLVNLRIIEKEMQNVLSKYKIDLQSEVMKFPKQTRSANETKYLERYEYEIKQFEYEIYRFSYGIKLIETKANVRTAFDLMNRTFKNTVSYPGWRLFQIVFIVSEIADVCYTEYKESPNFECQNIDCVDLIYFPTGGGKTETFLGCSFFAAFFDRIRGKKSGVTAFIKYPLRLLTAQQLDRVLALVMRANIIKNENGLLGDDFSTGFYTGSQNTPNSMNSEHIDFINRNSQDEINKKFRQIDKCPFCKQKTVNITFDIDSYLLKHKCDNCGDIPVSIVDNEIYRKPPTFLISTIDKMANIGLSSGFKTLLGKNYGKCTKHGLVFYKTGKCSCPNCKEAIVLADDVKDPAPTLFIQDELHLLNESLGTFDSHYERLISYFCDKLLPNNKQKKIKYIAASATISDYKAHCYNLYLKQSRCFPASIKNNNFYSFINENDLNRIIIGAKLYSSSITDAIQKVITYYRMIVINMERNLLETLDALKKKGFSGDSIELKEILNEYLISILYCNSKDDAGRVKSALENQGKIDLAKAGIEEFNFGSITGDDDFKKIKDTMHDIELVTNKKDGPNMIIATSAISHGVDEDCFNNIFFYGMPNKTAEYIQAYSRAGRKYTGIVIDAMRIVRNRDMSYLINFDSFHRYKDMLIEPVPIQRWAKNAVFNTLPGILSALLIHYFDCFNPMEVKEKLNHSLITYELIIDMISEIYGCNEVGAEGISYQKIISAELTSILDGFRTYNYDATNEDNNSISKVITNNNSINKRPMTNLRDVDVQLRLKRVG